VPKSGGLVFADFKVAQGLVISDNGKETAMKKRSNSVLCKANRCWLLLQEP